MREETYEEFVEKFKPKKTTDDCYTPPMTYDAVKDWACREYGIDPGKIVRPFYPGGDYENYDYPDGCVVLDNPPFSIISKIARLYNERNIDYFLFAPGLTLFNIAIKNDKTNCIIISPSLTYENGAKVGTGFITNLGNSRVRTAPELNMAIINANKQVEKKTKKQKTKIKYPENIVSSALLRKIAKVPFELKNEDLRFTREANGFKIYGCGAYISSRKAAELKAAELKAEKSTKIIELNDEEKQIIEGLDQIIGR